MVVGSGPNGLTAAVTLARAGWKVKVLEAAAAPGGGTRSEELTLPGYTHDVCSAVHPLGLGSPALRGLPLEAHGLRWIQPDAPLAHPLGGGRVALLERSVDATAEGLGRADRAAYRRLMEPLVGDGVRLVDSLLAPLSFPSAPPQVLARYGLHGIRSARALAMSRFEGDQARALMAGMAAHSMLPLNAPITAGYGLMLGLLGHLVGWPIAEEVPRRSPRPSSPCWKLMAGSSSSSTGSDPSTSCLPPRWCSWTSRPAAPGGRRRPPSGPLPPGHGEVPLRPRRVQAGLGPRRTDSLVRPGLCPSGDGPCGRSTRRGGGVGGHGRPPSPQRAPVRAAGPALVVRPVTSAGGGQTASACCHVPHGSTVDMTAAIEAQVERFAPGFRDRIIARHVMGPAAMEHHDANYIGGDINGGVADLRQFIARPVLSLRPWATPIDGVYLCSSSTPPGGGVHGMCG